MKECKRNPPLCPFKYILMQSDGCTSTFLNMYSIHNKHTCILQKHNTFALADLNNSMDTQLIKNINSGIITSAIQLIKSNSTRAIFISLTTCNNQPLLLENDPAIFGRS